MKREVLNAIKLQSSAAIFVSGVKPSGVRNVSRSARKCVKHPRTAVAKLAAI